MSEGTDEKWEAWVRYMTPDSLELLCPAAAGDVGEGSAEFPAAMLSDGRSQHLAGSCMHLSTTDYLTNRCSKIENREVKEADAETDPFF